MGLNRTDFDNISVADLVELLDNSVPESLYVEYKRDSYGNSDSDKKEFLKDVSAFANSHGGHLLIGIDENQGLPVELSGIEAADADGLIQAFENRIRDGIAPRIQGIRLKAVVLPSGSKCIVIRIPKSWYPPHRVSFAGTNKFWIRNSSGSHEASVDELRQIFTSGNDAIEKLKSHHYARVDEIRNGTSTVRLQREGRLIIHVMPLSAVTTSSQIDLHQVYEKRSLFSPIGASGSFPRINFDGFINIRTGAEVFLRKR